MLAMHHFSKRSLAILFVAISIPIFILLLGMRVPNLSRPHGPRPMHRALIQDQSGIFGIAATTNQSVDPVMQDDYLYTEPLTETGHIHYVIASSSPPHLAFWSIASRAPPSKIFYS